MDVERVKKGLTMIVWINGAFGSGKTQTAKEICRRLQGAFLFDPENAGYYLRQNEPVSLQADNFQDEPLWREINVKMLHWIAAEYDGIIVAPMTVIEEEYYHQIITALRQAGVIVHHVVLKAEKETLYKRLRSRLEGRQSWAAQQIDDCLRAFENPVFENQIQTDDMTISQVADAVARICGLQLQPAPGKVRQKLEQLMTQLRCIRK